MSSLGTRLMAAFVLTLGLITAGGAEAATTSPATTPPATSAAARATAAPTAVKVIPAWDSAQVTWTAAAGATSYSVCFLTSRTSTGCAGARSGIAATSTVITGLKPRSGTDYFVRVRAHGPAGTSDAALVAAELAPKSSTRPPAPAGVVVKPGWNSAAVTWQPSKGATSYSVCLLANATTTTCSFAGRNLTSTTFDATGLTPTGGTDYYVRVRANNATGYTDARAVAMNLQPDPRPAATTGITARVTAPSTVTISWKAVPGVTAYTACLLAATTSTTCTHSITTTSTSAVFTNIGTTGGGDWAPRVFTRKGPYTTASAKGAFFDMPVGQVAGTKATRASASSSTATWTSTVNARSYQVQFATNAAMTSGLRTITSTTPTATATALSKGRLYHVRVRGVNDKVVGRWSSIAQVRLLAADTQVVIATWNLCGQDKCLTKSNGMKSWSSTRKRLAGEYISLAKAGIIATQESHDKDTRFGTVLPGYGVAAYYSAKTLFYDKSLYGVERNGTITLNAAEKKYAVWAEMRALDTGARFIVVDAHLQPYKGKRNDDMRFAQTGLLLSTIARANPEKLPVVYAGDFNSNKSNAQSKYPGGYDAVARRFASAAVSDAITAAPDAKTYRPDWNSANQGINPPLRNSDHVDAVYVDPRIQVTEWMMMVRASNGRYTTPFASDHNPIRVKLTVPGI